MRAADKGAGAPLLAGVLGELQGANFSNGANGPLCQPTRPGGG